MKTLLPEIRKNCDQCVQLLKSRIETINALGKTSALTILTRRILEKHPVLNFEQLQNQEPDEQKIAEDILEFWGDCIESAELMFDMKAVFRPKKGAAELENMLISEAGRILDILYSSINVFIGPEFVILSGYIKAFNGFIDQSRISDEVLDEIIEMSRKDVAEAA